MYGKHIAFITPGFAANEADSTCITALQLLTRALCDLGCQLTVFALHYPFTNVEYQWHGVQVVPLNGRNSRLQREIFLKNKLRRAFQRVHSENPVQIIHSFWLNEASVWGIELGQKNGIPVVCTAMGQDVLVKNRFLQALKRRSPDVVISLSGFQRQELFRSAGISSDVIPHGIDADQIFPLKKDISVIGIGSLISLKNFSYFIQVCSELRKIHADPVIYLVGEGPEKTELEKMIRSYQLDDVVKLTGAVSYEKTLNLLARSTVLMHPSSFEGFGMVVIEALQLQTHVLASSVGFAADCSFIPKLTGDAHTDALQLTEMLNVDLPEKRTFSSHDSAVSYLDVYEHLLKTIQ